MGSEEVFPCFFTVVFPANDGGVGEEDDADGNDVAADRSDIVREGCHGEGHAGQGLAVSAKGAEDAGGSNGETGDGANDDGVDEGAGHGNVALSCRTVSRGSSGRDGS